MVFPLSGTGSIITQILDLGGTQSQMDEQNR